MALLWKPLLAATLKPGADLSALPYPLYGSPKIDGFRAMVQNGVVVSRKGLPIRNKAVQEIFGHNNEYEGLDGELIIGKPYGDDTFNRTTDKGLGVNNGSEAAAKHFEKHGAFWFFDFKPCALNTGHAFASDDLDFEARLLKCIPENGAWVDQGVHGYLRVVEQTLIRTAAQLEKFEAKCLAKGYEGVMLRKSTSGVYPQKPGKDNRSTLREFDLVKLKRFEYALATIYDFHMLEHNVNEAKTAAGKRSSAKAGIVVDEHCVGSATLVSKQFGKFTISVPTNLLREKGLVWWAKQRGKAVRFKYQVAGTKDKPRIPICGFKELL